MAAFSDDWDAGVTLTGAYVGKDRTRKLMALGNAIVPQVAYQLFLAVTSEGVS